jgi:hypothetical protein
LSQSWCRSQCDSPGSRRVILEIRVDKAVEESGRQEQVAVIGQHGRLSEKASAQGHTGRVELRQVHLHHIMLCYKLCSDPAECRRDHTFTDPRRHGYTDDLHTVQSFFEQQGWVILRGHHCDLMPSFDEGTRQPLSVNGQPRRMRTIVGKNCENFHIDFLFRVSNPKKR